MILDADGLNLLAENPDWKLFLGENVIVTPHMGEMSRLTGKSIEEIRNNRIEAAVSYAEETGTVCVLKDACTVTAGPKGEAFINLSGNSGMAAAEAATYFPASWREWPVCTGTARRDIRLF